jgi:hypothetical protein
MGDGAAEIRRIGRWAHGLLPAYLALLTGALSGRDAGLYGQSTVR